MAKAIKGLLAILLAALIVFSAGMAASAASYDVYFLRYLLSPAISGTNKAVPFTIMTRELEPYYQAYSGYGEYGLYSSISPNTFTSVINAFAKVFPTRDKYADDWQDKIIPIVAKVMGGGLSKTVQDAEKKLNEVLNGIIKLPSLGAAFDDAWTALRLALGERFSIITLFYGHTPDSCVTYSEQIKRAL